MPPSFHLVAIWSESKIMPRLALPLPRVACVAIARLCGIAPGAALGGCDPLQPASIAATAQTLSARQ
jgi:hypothetical protein